MENKINFLFKEAHNIENEELQSHFINYICIKLSGYIEVNINIIICKYKDKSLECTKSISTIQNATWCKIKPMFSLIDLELTIKLQNEIIKMNIIDILYNLIKNRNDIAHGKDITILTLSQLEKDFKEIKLFIQKTKKIFECLD